MNYVVERNGVAPVWNKVMWLATWRNLFAEEAARKVPCAWEMKGTIMRHLIEDTAHEKRELIDGVKVSNNGSSVMILPDADMALFHVTAEAESEKKAQELVSNYVNKIKKWQG